ncbi:MAG: hypothetical protein WA970_11145 [Gammaproteobacteria bacterium]
MFAGFWAIGDRDGGLARVRAEITPGRFTGLSTAVSALCLGDRGESAGHGLQRGLFRERGAEGAGLQLSGDIVALTA